MKKVNSIRYEQTITVFVFVGFIVCSLFTQYLPVLRNLSVLITLAFSVILLLNAFYTLDEPSKQVVTLFTALALSQLIFNIARTEQADLSSFIAIMLGLLLKNNINTSVKYIAVVNNFTLVIMLYELLTSSYLIVLVDQKFEFGRLQGLFSYSKEAGYYAIAATFYLFMVKQISRISLLTLFSIATLSGTRTAILFIIAVCVVIVINHIKIRIPKSKIRNFIITAFMLISLGYILIKYYFIGKSLYMLNRIYLSFYFKSSSHQDRLFAWKSYLDEINNYSWYEILFGAGTKINIIIGNGAESYYLMIFSQYGLVTLSFILSFFILILTKLKNYDEKIVFLCFLVILQVGRVGVGWSDGILIWAAFFYIVDTVKRDNINATKIHL